jgi:hypothetical protein
MPCRIDLHPNILSSYLSHVKQHVLLHPITCTPEIEHPIRIDNILLASAHVKSPLLMANWEDQIRVTLPRVKHLAFHKALVLGMTCIQFAEFFFQY